MPCTYGEFNISLIHIVLWVGGWGMIEHLLDVFLDLPMMSWFRPKMRTAWFRFGIYALLFFAAMAVLLTIDNATCV
uniref:Uncharacterized protein n=1 Tax=viral metagenome TaxID=1070528 RepID=A0A6C0CLI2_9ZZZZ